MGSRAEKGLTPTLATGHSSNGLPHRPAQRHSCSLPLTTAGFSLLEVLVVVFIVGVLATMFTLSVGVIGRDREVQNEADRLVALVALAREEAVIQGHEIGMRFYADGYDFAAFHEDFVEYHDKDNPDQSSWALLDQGSLLGPRALPAGLLLELQIEGRDVVLGRAQDVAAKLGKPPDPADSEAQDARTRYQPQVMIYSSGDMSPFTVRLRREFANAGTTMEFEIDGSVAIEEAEQ